MVVSELAQVDELNVGEFAAFISHELRNPLSIILGNAEYLLGATKEWSGDELMVSIRQEAVRAITILHGLTALVDASAPEPVSVSAACHKIAEVFMGQHDDVHIALDLQDELPLAQASQAQLDEVLENLVYNAQKYGSPGTVIGISARSREDDVLVSVVNQGIELPATEMHNIFLSGYRLEQHQGTPGQGLGLSLCKRMVEGWSGRIWCESRLPAETAFNFTVPFLNRSA